MPLPVAGLLAADDVDLVLNLTIPAAHAEVAHAAIAAGKHVYGEKPLAVIPGRRVRCWLLPTAPGCGWAARPIRYSAPGSRRRGQLP